MIEIELKRCTLDDLPLLRALAEKTFRESFAAYNTAENMENYVRDAFGVEKMKGELENPEMAFYMAVAEGQPIGYIKLNTGGAMTDPQGEQSMELERIYLLAAYQGKGAGGILLQKAVDCAVAAGKAYLWLGVWDENHRAMNFYEKHGFYRFGQHAFTLGTEIQTDFFFRKDLWG
jgi:ribosomal protein S18 acetylase RimI-like enzyme